jgi:hypothetical protein
VVATRSAAFASPCGFDAVRHAHSHGPHTAAALLTVYACVPLNASANVGFAARVDPLLRTYTPNAFVGRLAPADARQAPQLDDWEGVIALAFELEHEELVESGDTAFTCTRGVARGVPPGRYNYTVVHEFSGYAWDAPWDPAGTPGSHFGTPLVSLEERTPQFEPLPTTGEVLEVTTPRDATFALPDCGRGALDGTWRAGRYEPFGCVLRDVSGDRFDRCMSRLNGTVVLMGDSNSRRTFKAIYGRSNWCPVADAAREEAMHCQCEDCGYECLAPENGMCPSAVDIIACPVVWMSRPACTCSPARPSCSHAAALFSGGVGRCRRLHRHGRHQRHRWRRRFQ